MKSLKGVPAVFIFLVALHIPTGLWAWGKEGHQLVAEVAWQLLDNGTRQRVQKYLGSTSVTDAAGWMDDVKGDSKYDFMKSWHYVNIEKGQAYSPGKEP